MHVTARFALMIVLDAYLVLLRVVVVRVREDMLAHGYHEPFRQSCLLRLRRTEPDGGQPKAANGDGRTECRSMEPVCETVPPRISRT